MRQIILYKEDMLHKSPRTFAKFVWTNGTALVTVHAKKDNVYFVTGKRTSGFVSVDENLIRQEEKDKFIG